MQWTDLDITFGKGFLTVWRASVTLACMQMTPVPSLLHDTCFPTRQANHLDARMMPFCDRLTVILVLAGKCSEG